MVLIVGKASLVCSVASSLLFACLLHGVLFGWWGVWVLSVGGVFMSLIGRGVSVVRTHNPHTHKALSAYERFDFYG